MTNDIPCKMSTLLHQSQHCPPIAPFETTQTKRYTYTDVSEHSEMDSCWIIMHDKVYDVTKFLNLHPGGYDILLEHAGKDATIPFEEKGHSKIALGLLQEYYIGELMKN